MARIGINGFGRIGRYLVRLMAERNEFPVVINARADNASLAHLFKYDSVHHTFKGTVGHDENGIIINGTHIAVTRCKPNEWQWKDYGVDLVVESTGTIKKRAGLAEHMACGAKKVIMSAPVSDADITIVMGVNDGLYDPAKHDVVSSASCTTNCLAPVAKVLNDTFGIEHGLMTTIHSYTMSQRILDGSQKDIRRARAAGQAQPQPRRARVHLVDGRKQARHALLVRDLARVRELGRARARPRRSGRARLGRPREHVFVVARADHVDARRVNAVGALDLALLLAVQREHGVQAAHARHDALAREVVRGHLPQVGGVGHGP